MVDHYVCHRHDARLIDCLDQLAEVIPTAVLAVEVVQLSRHVALRA